MSDPTPVVANAAPAPPTGGGPATAATVEGPRRRRKRRDFDELWQVFLESQKSPEGTAAVLRRQGLHASDLRRFTEVLRQGGRQEWQARRRRKFQPEVTPEEVERLRGEVARVSEALKEQTIENVLLKKKVNGV
jgi:hypothetical protein